MYYNPLMPHVLKETSEGIVKCSVQDEMFKAREVECLGEVTPESVNALILQLRYLAREEPGREITMYINSPGGDVSSGLALYDVMRAIKCPIRTVCVGLAASMGALLFSCGDRRDMLPHARVMIHDPRILSGLGGDALHIENISRELMKTRKITGAILAEHTGRDIEEILAHTAADSYFDAREAVAFGLADRVISEL